MPVPSRKKKCWSAPEEPRYLEIPPGESVWLESDLESDGEGVAEAGGASAQAFGVLPASRGRQELGVGFRGAARRSVPLRKGRAAGSARAALSTSLRGAKGVVNPMSPFFSKNMPVRWHEASMDWARSPSTSRRSRTPASSRPR